jgi:hypothetical protein
LCSGGRERILGATIVAPRAGEMIGLWGLAIQRGLKIGAIAASLAPLSDDVPDLDARGGRRLHAGAVLPRTRRLVEPLERL